MKEVSNLDSPPFRPVVRGLIALHELIKAGQEESAEADLVRDAMDAPLKLLSGKERLRAQWLSEDLYSYSEPRPIIGLKPSNNQFQRKMREAFAFRKRGLWDDALALLRRWKDYVVPAELSYLRASIWAEAGVPEAAAIFYRHAHALAPEHIEYHVLYLVTLSKFDTALAGSLSREILGDPANKSPALVAQAAGIVFGESKLLAETEAVLEHRALVPLIEQSLHEIEANWFEKNRSSYAMLACILGFCYESLDDDISAREAFSRGLNRDPKNESLLTARGMLLYGQDAAAVTDLLAAVNLRSPVVWPYFFLSHHYLEVSKFRECVKMCDLALSFDASNSVKSLLVEWKAISCAELGLPATSVKHLFEKATALDSLNQTAVRNMDAFNNAAFSNATEAKPEYQVQWSQIRTADLREMGLTAREYHVAA